MGAEDVEIVMLALARKDYVVESGSHKASFASSAPRAIGGLFFAGVLVILAAVFHFPSIRGEVSVPIAGFYSLLPANLSSREQ